MLGKIGELIMDMYILLNISMVVVAIYLATIVYIINSLKKLNRYENNKSVY